MQRLYIDFDGVIMDTIPLLYKRLNEANIEPGKDGTEEFIAGIDFNEIVKDKYILNDSINSIKKILDSHKYEVSILTHVNSLDEAVVKIKYIRSYFSQMNVLIVPKKVSKTDVIHCENAILIDDYSGNLKEWTEKGGIGIRFNQEMDDKGYICIDRLDKILDIDIKERQ